MSVSAMAYQDFVLTIEPRPTPEGYPVLVSKSPAGEGRGFLKLPFTRDEIAGLRLGPGLALREARRELDADRERTIPVHFGERLFRALFTEEIRSLFDFSRGSLAHLSPESAARDGLRILLRFDPGHPDLLEICGLPWELIYHPRERNFLALNPLISFSRLLEVPTASPPLPFRLPLRILVAISSPEGLSPLDVETERRQIEGIRQLQDGVEVTVLRKTTVMALRQALQNGGFHIVHYIGHGGFDPASGEGTLVLENSMGKAAPLGGQQLGRLLQSSSPPLLVVLNACETARLQEPPGNVPFAGLSTALLQGGIPAVLAMQFPISDPTALDFSETFYRALAHGEGLDTAVSEGRLAIHSNGGGSLEWASPVLFRRGSTDELFSLPSLGPILVSPQRQSPSPPTDTLDGAKKLHAFQRDIYQLLDDLQIRALEDYQRRDKPEKELVSREILTRTIGLGTEPADLLELSHVNARFPSNALLHRPEVRGSLDVLHRKSAIYSDHSIICVPHANLSPNLGILPGSPFDPGDAIGLLLQHRELITAGKMSLVPEMVQISGDRYQCLFDAKQLDTVTVNLNDPYVRTVFLEKGNTFQRAGALVFKSPQGGGLNLLDILEIEDHHGAEYNHFQTWLRKTMGEIHPENETAALTRALREVDAGIQQLDAFYEQHRRQRRKEAYKVLASGALAVVLYAAGIDTTAFLAATFAGTSLSSLVSFVPDAKQIPDEIRQSPFFVPWLIKHRDAAA